MKHPSEQSVGEWLSDYDGTPHENKHQTSQVIDIRPKTKLDDLIARVKNAGITSVRQVTNGILIKTESNITNELHNKILNNLKPLTSIAEPDTGEPLYEYVEHRTLFRNRRPHLALVFKEIHTGTIAERYFNITLQNKKGKSFKTGIKGEFRIEGSVTRAMKGSFIKFWIDMVNEIPDSKPSHIYRYMKPKLSGVVISCPNPTPHYDGTKLRDWKCEGRLYKIT